MVFIWNMVWCASGKRCDALFSFNNSKNIIELNLMTAGVWLRLISSSYTREEMKTNSIFVYKTTKEIFSELFLFCALQQEHNIFQRKIFCVFALPLHFIWLIYKRRMVVECKRKRNGKLFFPKQYALTLFCGLFKHSMECCINVINFWNLKTERDQSFF